MGTIVLDAGVVIAMLERQDAHHREARTAILAARDRGDRFILPASAYSEVLVHPSRRDQRSVDIADQAIEAIPAQMLTPFIERRDGVPWLCIPADAGYPVTGEPLDSVARG